MENKKFEIVDAQSNIDWTGRKVTGAHNGTIAIKKGTIVLKDGMLAGGKFSIDMTSIKILDVKDPVANAQFAGHLASDDFFSSEKYPEAMFAISSVEEIGGNAYLVSGELTIKGITHPVSFTTILNIKGESLTASGKIIIDRTRYGIKFRSGNFFKNLGDTLIYNDFDLQVNIIAKLIGEPVLA